MISSEVQRTLVKSPPELWAELSDPDTLARHLRELGEIRITRIDPEHAVEWEAEDATGSVIIKPSGWGTKVTLTVTRRTPEATPEIAQMADAPLEVTHLPEAPYRLAQLPEAPHETPASGSPVTLEPPAEAARDTEDLPEMAPEAELEPPAEAEPVSIAGRERELAVVVEAEHRAEAEREATGESEVEPEATGKAQLEPPAEADAEAIDGAEPEDQPAPSEAVEEGEPDPPSESRRGFFARLFHRKPKEEATEPEPPIAMVWSLPELSDAGATGTQPPEPAWAVATPRPPSEQVGRGEPSELPEAADPLETVEPAETVEAHDTAEAFRSVTTARPLATIDTAQAAEEADTAQAAEQVDTVDAAEEVEVVDVVEAVNVVEARETAQEHADAQAVDISAELKAAEEVAAEQVTAVLTGMLDRLGAAHHRPFSRS